MAAAHAILASASSPPFLKYNQLLAFAASFPGDQCGGGGPWNALQALANASVSGGGLKANVRVKKKIVKQTLVSVHSLPVVCRVSLFLSIVFCTGLAHRIVCRHQGQRECGLHTEKQTLSCVHLLELSAE